MRFLNEYFLLSVQTFESYHFFYGTAIANRSDLPAGTPSGDSSYCGCCTLTETNPGRSTATPSRPCFWQLSPVDARAEGRGVSFGETRDSTLSMRYADGNITSFGWLPFVWQIFPKHRIVLLTDSDGLYQPVVPLASRKRTSAIQVHSGSYCRVEATVQKFAERFVHVSRLDEIASAWSLVIPCRAQQKGASPHASLFLFAFAELHASCVHPQSIASSRWVELVESSRDGDQAKRSVFDSASLI